MMRKNSFIFPRPIYLPTTKLTIHRIFYVTFVRNKIESCGFHRWKEEIKMHRIIRYRLVDLVFLRFSIELFVKQRS